MAGSLNARPIGGGFWEGRIHRSTLATGLAVALGVVSSIYPVQAQSTAPASRSGVMSGVVKGASGTGVAGALVRVENDERGVAFVVVSQAGGRYETPELPPGKYTVRAFGGDHQSALSAPVAVESAHPATVDLSLNTALVIPPRDKRMTDAELEKFLPEGPAKKFVADQCSTCHSLLPVLSARKSRQEWQVAYDRMLDDLFDMRKLMIYHQPSDNSDLVLGYLAKSFGPDTPPDPKIQKELLLTPGGPAHPNRNLPGSLLMKTPKYVAMEFSLPAGAQAHDIAVDSHGVAWVSETNTGMLGRFDAKEQAYTQLAVPKGKEKPRLNAVTVGTGDSIWFADDGPNGRIMRYDPQTKSFAGYPMPAYRFMVSPTDGWARTEMLRVAGGSVWALESAASRILKLDFATNQIVDYTIPKGSEAYGLVVDENNSLWFSSTITSQIDRIDSRTTKFTKYYVPIEEKERTDLRGLASDADGNLWVASTEKGKLLKLDTHNGHFADFDPPSADSGPVAVDVDLKHNYIWFSEAYTDRIARFDPKTKTFIEFPSPAADCDLTRLAVDQNHPNRVWWAGGRSGKIGYIETIE